MKHIYTALLALTLPAMAATADVARTAGSGLPDITNFVYKTQSKSIDFKSPAFQNATETAVRFKAGAAQAAESQTPTPLFTIGPGTICGDVDGPDGSVLFYTFNLDYELIEHEYFTEKILRGYSLNIYNSDNSLIGSIKDNVRYAEDEVRAVYCDLTPLVTRHFFNNDDKLEVIISLVMNSTTPGYNHEKSIVYQLDGAKDNDGNDIPVMEMPEVVANVLDVTTPGGPENYYITFMNESYEEYDGTTDYWTNLTQAMMNLSVYTKVDAAGELQKVLDYGIRMVDLPGDQDVTPFIMSMVNNNKGYFVFSHYGDSLFNPYDFMEEDVTQREENSLVVDIYELNGNSASKIQTTTIPFTKDNGDGLLASFYSVGNLRYTGDVNFNDYGTTGGKAAIIVGKGNKMTEDDESLIYSYYIYNPDGSLRNTIIENTAGSMGMSDIAGQEMQQMFITSDGKGGYIYRFVDLVSCKEVLAMNYQIEVEDNDPDPITSNIDRVPYGDSYVYAGELRYPTEEDDITYMRVIWFDNKGNHIRTDETNMGANVHYASCNIDCALLKKGAITNSDNMAYMILIKRGIDETASQEELLIAEACSDSNPDGREILHLTPCDKGVLANITTFSHIGLPLMMVVYTDESGYTMDFYRLPLEGTSGISPVMEAGTTGAIRYNGTTVSAEGFIEIFDIKGARVAAGNDSVSLEGLAAGIYIAKAGDNIAKILVK